MGKKTRPIAGKFLNTVGAINAMHGKRITLISANLAQYLDKSFNEFIEIDIADTGRHQIFRDQSLLTF